jgi:hypothetical protein
MRRGGGTKTFGGRERVPKGFRIFGFRKVSVSLESERFLDLSQDPAPSSAPHGGVGNYQFNTNTKHQTPTPTPTITSSTYLSLANHHRYNLRQQIQHVQCMRSRRSTTHRLYSTSCYIHRTSLRSAALLSQDHHTQVGKTNLVSIHRPGIAGAARTWYISFCTLSK